MGGEERGREWEVGRRGRESIEKDGRAKEREDVGGGWGVGWRGVSGCVEGG